MANNLIGLREAAMELYIIRQLGPVYPLWVKVCTSALHLALGGNSSKYVFVGIQLLMYGLISFCVCGAFFRGGFLGTTFRTAPLESHSKLDL